MGRLCFRYTTRRQAICLNGLLFCWLLRVCRLACIAFFSFLFHGSNIRFHGVQLSLRALRSHALQGQNRSDFHGLCGCSAHPCMKKAAQLRQGVRSQLAQASALYAPGSQIIGLRAGPQDDAASKFGCPCSIHQMRRVAEKPDLLQMQRILTKNLVF